MTDFSKKIRRIPGFPKKEVIYWDFTTLWQDAGGFRGMIDSFVDEYRDKEIDKIASIESRGFVVGAPLAYQLNKGFIMIRKKGKLPSKKIEESYEKEYGKDTIEVHTDAVEKGDKVLLIDDLLATGDTILAAARLVERLGGEVIGIAFIVEFTDFKAQERLKDYEVFSLIKGGEGE